MEVDSHTEQLAQQYLRSVHRGNTRIEPVPGWDGARRAARDLGWDRELLAAQITERHNLRRQADELHKPGGCETLLEDSFKAISVAANIALETAQHANPGDISIAKAAVGAFSEAAFDTALSMLTETVAHHPAKLKFALFQVGRWPLTITKKQFFLF